VETRAELLRFLRLGRGFEAGEALAAKVGRLRRWFAEAELDTAVVGVSGGVDSAVTLGLLRRLQDEEDSPLQRVVALLLPVDGPGTTGQGDATGRGRLAAEALGAEVWTVPLGAAQEATATALTQASGHQLEGWAAGQLASVVRTPALYGAAAQLRALGHRAVVVGTTNRDEGAYLGFYGKASDGMVDLQPLSDLHKSEVRSLAETLGVPREIIDAEPSGDVWDGRTDAEMIGAGYDDVELVLRLRELGRDPRSVAAALADPTEAAALVAATDAADALHSENAHKYRVGSPAVHLDVLPRGVLSGWPDEAVSGRDEHPPDHDAVPGRWDPPADLRLCADGWPAVLPHVEPLAHRIVLASDLLTPAECNRLIDAMHTTSHPAPVDVTGVRGPVGDAYGVGSMRATAWAPELARDLWHRLRPAVPSVRFLGPNDATDGFATTGRTGHVTWRVVGLSPLLRFMRYDPGGRHLAHYDAGYDYGDGRRTLLSVVWYLTGTADPDAGGATRFIVDGQEDQPVWARDHRDWDRPTRADEVHLAMYPTRGAAIVFDHRLPHDVEPWKGPGGRVIIRADVVYEAIPDGRTLP
jgi:NAD+ synthetase